MKSHWEKWVESCAVTVQRRLIVARSPWRWMMIKTPTLRKINRKSEGGLQMQGSNPKKKRLQFHYEQLEVYLISPYWYVKIYIARLRTKKLVEPEISRKVIMQGLFWNWKLSSVRSLGKEASYKGRLCGIKLLLVCNVDLLRRLSKVYPRGDSQLGLVPIQMNQTKRPRPKQTIFFSRFRTNRNQW